MRDSLIQLCYPSNCIITSFCTVCMVVTAPMLVVGFQVIYSVVDEAVGNKFTCLEIFSGGPLDNNASVLFYTRDGSAVGKYTRDVFFLV